MNEFSRRPDGAVVELRDVTRAYGSGGDVVVALDQVSLAIRKGDFVSIAGPSGSGKSTILNLIGCTDLPTTGTVAIQGQVTTALTENRIKDLRHDLVGLVLQPANLIPMLSVWENIVFPLLLRETRDRPRDRRAWIDFLIREVDLTPWKSHLPGGLSQDQRQRVALARALVTRPALVLADEPTADLDPVTAERIIMLMRKLNRVLATTMVFSTRDPVLASAADHVIQLSHGRMVQEKRAQGDRRAAAVTMGSWAWKP